MKVEKWLSRAAASTGPMKCVRGFLGYFRRFGIRCFVSTFLQTNSLLLLYFRATLLIYSCFHLYTTQHILLVIAFRIAIGTQMLSHMQGAMRCVATVSTSSDTIYICSNKPAFTTHSKTILKLTPTRLVYCCITISIWVVRTIEEKERCNSTLL